MRGLEVDLACLLVGLDLGCGWLWAQLRLFDALLLCFGAGFGGDVVNRREYLALLHGGAAGWVGRDGGMAGKSR